MREEIKGTVLYSVYEGKNFFIDFTAHLGLGFSTLLVQYYSVICRPSDHTVGRPRAEMRTWYGRSRRKDSNHYRPPHLLKELRE